MTVQDTGTQGYTLHGPPGVVGCDSLLRLSAMSSNSECLTSSIVWTGVLAGRRPRCFIQPDSAAQQFPADSDTSEAASLFLFWNLRTVPCYIHLWYLFLATRKDAKNVVKFLREITENVAVSEIFLVPLYCNRTRRHASPPPPLRNDYELRDSSAPLLFSFQEGMLETRRRHANDNRPDMKIGKEIFSLKTNGSQTCLEARS